VSGVTEYFVTQLQLTTQWPQSSDFCYLCIKCYVQY